MNVRLIAETKGLEEFEGKSGEEIIIGIARVSTNKKGDELFQNPIPLLRHCLTNGHWSIFEQVDLTFEITCEMSIGEQYLRHRSMVFQKFSGRYSSLSSFTAPLLRYQADDNRQSSTKECAQPNWDNLSLNSLKVAFDTYGILLSKGVAKECARFILPACTNTKFYMKGNLRSFITLLNVRLEQHAQKEAVLIAKEIANIIKIKFPAVSEALFNFEYSDTIPIIDQLILDKYNVRNLVLENK